MTSPGDQEVSPPWGYLLAEQYLIRNWDSASPSPPDEQRRTLIRAFLALDHTPEEWSPADDTVPRPPTAAEIANVLQPWRPLALRRIAAHIVGAWQYDLIILRTNYGGGSDDAEKMREWLEVDEEEDEFFDEETLWWRFLDDPALLDVGEDWERVLDVLPELAGRTGGARCKTGISAADLAEARGSEDPEGEIQLLAFAGPAPLLVADEEAFREGMLRVLFLDNHGNIVRHSRIAPEKMAELKESGMIFRLDRCQWWEYGEVGEKYTARGEIGRALYTGRDD